MTEDKYSGWKAALAAVRDANNDAAWAMSEFINESPCAITPALLREMNSGMELPEELLYAVLMAGMAGIPPEDTDLTTYFIESVKCLEADRYREDSYLRTIVFPETSSGNWRLTHYAYKPYEAFVRDDIRHGEGNREIPLTGYFKERFVYPAVEQDGREWMAVKPSEIETMREALNMISGDIAVFGLGLGYFAFMASQNPAVKTIDIIEKDIDAIKLFTTHILPQFPNRHKIREIIHTDAFEYMEKKMQHRNYGFAFIDLWHDASDGLPMYLKTKRMEHLNPEVKFLYWVERTLLSAYRWRLFDRILEESESAEEALEKMSDKSLARRAAAGEGLRENDIEADASGSQIID